MEDHPAQPTDPAVASDSSTVTVRRGAKALIGSSSRVLLVRERHADGRDFWTLPGGGVQSDESAEEGLRRELVEEIQCPAIVDAPVSEFWYPHRSSPGTVSQYTVFSCSVVSTPQPVRSEGILETAWIDPAKLPPRTLPEIRQFLQTEYR